MNRVRRWLLFANNHNSEITFYVMCVVILMWMTAFLILVFKR